MHNIDILLIEDDLVDQKAFERMVSSNNLPYNYQIVDSVAKTKQVLKNNKYDIIVSDYMLPDGKSFENLLKSAFSFILLPHGEAMP